MTQQDQLGAAVHAFEQWRATRANSSEKTPATLRQQAIALQGKYPRSKITSALNVSGSNFKLWQQESTATQIDETAFITLPSVTTPPLNLTLDFISGCKLQLSGDITPELLCALTKQVAV